MIWRLMAMILVMSDTGSVALVTDHTDWPDEMSCRNILQSHFKTPPPTEFNGHTVNAKVSATCVPVEDRYGGQSQVPPPIAEIIPRMFPGTPLPCNGRLPCPSR